LHFPDPCLSLPSAHDTGFASRYAISACVAFFLLPPANQLPRSLLLLSLCLYPLRRLLLLLLLLLLPPEPAGV
jgi:hypothetical protein